jgi:hypothetical protein
LIDSGGNSSGGWLGNKSEHEKRTIIRSYPFMKTFPFRVSKWLWLDIPLCLGIGIFYLCCKPLTSKEISGVYVCSYNGVIDTVILNANGTFQQTITYKEEGPWIRSGSWKLDWQVVHFSCF